MRKVVYGAACSLDGFIASADGSFDWLHFSADVQQEIAKTWKTMDVLLMGRKTWDVWMAQGGQSAPAEKKRRTYLFSRTLGSSPSPDVELVQGNAGDFVRSLKEQPGKDICVMGGGELARSLFAARVVDEVGLNIHPVLLGSGIPMFRDAGRVKLELFENRTLDGGCVLVKYHVHYE